MRWLLCIRNGRSRASPANRFLLRVMVALLGYAVSPDDAAAKDLEALAVMQRCCKNSSEQDGDCSTTRDSIGLDAMTVDRRDQKSRGKQAMSRPFQDN